MSMTLEQQIARVNALRAPYMPLRQSNYGGQITQGLRLKLKVYDDAIRAGTDALNSGDADAQATALATLAALT